MIKKDAIIPTISSHKISEIFIKKLMKCGKRRTSEKLLEKIQEDIGGWYKIENGIKKLLPKIMTKPIKKGAIISQVPISVPIEKQYKIAIKWLLDASRKRIKRGGITSGIINELRDISKGYGTSYRKKQEISRLALANRASLNIMIGEKKKGE